MMDWNPFTDKSAIGNILVDTHAITRDQLLIAIGRKAQHDDMLLGVLLRELGFCNAEQVARALTIQAKMRKGDAGNAALDAMTARMDAFNEKEDKLSRAIDSMQWTMLKTGTDA